MSKEPRMCDRRFYAYNPKASACPSCTDRELLELAAKAAGIDLSFNVRRLYEKIAGVSGSCATWNPLTDDGDALRLVKRLNMTIAYEPSRGGWSAGAVVVGEFKLLAHDDDLLRAITCAAAEIGRRMA